MDQGFSFLSTVMDMRQDQAPDLSSSFAKVFPGVELNKSNAVEESDSLVGAARKLLKTLKADSSADRVHEQPKQFKVGQKFAYGQCELTLISSDAETSRLRLPSGDVAVVPASVIDALVSSDPAVFNIAVASLGTHTGSTFESLMEHSITADGGELTGKT